MSNDKQPEQQPEVNVEQTTADNAPETAAAGEGEQTQNEQAQSPDQARIAELEAALATSEATIAENKDIVLRAKAEMENARRRAEQEVEKARKFALERFASELLPVIDNLERALDVADAENEAVKPLVEGVELTHKTFLSTVEKFGLKVVNPQGEAFNPELHQAMSMQESSDVAPNTVLAVMQKGYELNGRLVRPAMVMVSRAASEGVDTQA